MGMATELKLRQKGERDKKFKEALDESIKKNEKLLRKLAKL